MSPEFLNQRLQLLFVSQLGISMSLPFFQLTSMPSSIPLRAKRYMYAHLISVILLFRHLLFVMTI